LRALIQRVGEASVAIDGDTVGCIGEGLLVLVGVGQSDTTRQAARLAEKVAKLRVFDDDSGRMDRSLVDLGAAAGALCVSQFTLYADTRRGLRPSFTEAAEPGLAESLYESFCSELAGRGVRVERGRFGARMTVSLRNEGPVTLLLEA
jgi:D-aminoacyl-tRNA deacylase